MNTLPIQTKLEIKTIKSNSVAFNKERVIWMMLDCLDIAGSSAYDCSYRPSLIIICLGYVLKYSGIR